MPLNVLLMLIAISCLYILSISLKMLKTVYYRLELLYAFPKRILLKLVVLLPLKIIISLLIMPRKARRWPLRYVILKLVASHNLFLGVFGLYILTFVSEQVSCALSIPCNLSAFLNSISYFHWTVIVGQLQFYSAFAL